MLQTFQQTAQEALGRRPIPLLLHQDVQHNAMLVHRAPQVMQHASDTDKRLIKVPCVPWPRPAPAEPLGELSAELLAPGPDTLVGDRHAAPGQDQLDITQAEAEHVTQPHGVIDDLGREAVATVRTGFWRHLGSFTRLASWHQPRLTWQCPTPVSWGALKAQFGGGVGRMDNFRARFLENLRLALAVYRDARVSVEERGLVLHPSRPPVVAKERAVR